MAGPLGVLLAAPAASTTEFDDDVNGAPPRGRCRWVRQRPPLRFKTMSMAGPLGGAVGESGSIRNRVLKTTSMVAPLAGATGGSGNVHHRV
jgi:hypothetical protein